MGLKFENKPSTAWQIFSLFNIIISIMQFNQFLDWSSDHLGILYDVAKPYRIDTCVEVEGFVQCALFTIPCFIVIKLCYILAIL